MLLLTISIMLVLGREMLYYILAYVPSCQYLEGPATQDFVILVHIPTCTIVADTVTI